MHVSINVWLRLSCWIPLSSHFGLRRSSMGWLSSIGWHIKVCVCQRAELRSDRNLPNLCSHCIHRANRDRVSAIQHRSFCLPIQRRIFAFLCDSIVQQRRRTMEVFLSGAPTNEENDLWCLGSQMRARPTSFTRTSIMPWTSPGALAEYNAGIFIREVVEFLV
jgi:hypothetical protein